MKRSAMTVALALVIGILLPFVGGYLFLVGGGMPVATKGPPLPFERFIARTAIHAAMSGADKPSPLEANEENLRTGAHVYLHNCAVCHGQPGEEASNIARGLFPEPP